MYCCDALKVASLIRAVGEDVNAIYGEQTSANTSSLANTYENLGMTFTKYGNEDSIKRVTREEIMDMIILKNCPVNVRADSNITRGDKVGHSFIIDGWLRLEYSLLQYKAIDVSVGETILQEDNVQRNFDLAHINFGWNGWYDGYYLPDAFDLTQNKYEEYAEENDNSGIAQYVYDMNVKYLIYDLR